MGVARPAKCQPLSQTRLRNDDSLSGKLEKIQPPPPHLELGPALRRPRTQSPFATPPCLSIISPVTSAAAPHRGWGTGDEELSSPLTGGKFFFTRSDKNAPTTRVHLTVSLTLRLSEVRSLEEHHQEAVKVFCQVELSGI